jgi:(2R)-sulfolactate sulfo-lyase subunit alpha
MSHKFLVHAKQDSVGVAVEDIHAGEMAEGIILEGESIITMKALQNIPLGHKIALVPIRLGEMVKKYGESIGTAAAAIQAGEHVHVHNLRSARW